MYTDKELCIKSRELYPKVGECSIDINVVHDDDKKFRVVDLKKDGHELKHYLESPDTDNCMEENQCVSLDLEKNQLRKNIKGQQF